MVAIVTGTLSVWDISSHCQECTCKYIFFFFFFFFCCLWPCVHVCSSIADLVVGYMYIAQTTSIEHKIM